MRSLSTFQKIKGNNNNNNNTVSWNFSTCLKRTLIFSRNCFLTTAASWSFPVTQYGFPVLLRPSRNGVFGYQAFHVENTSPAKQSRVEENKASAWGWAAPPEKGAPWHRKQGRWEQLSPPLPPWSSEPGGTSGLTGEERHRDLPR